MYGNVLQNPYQVFADVAGHDFPNRLADGHFYAEPILLRFQPLKKMVVPRILHRFLQHMLVQISILIVLLAYVPNERSKKLSTHCIIGLQ